MNPNSHPSRINFSKLVFGTLLIVAGALYSLDRFGYFDARDLVDYWPLILVAVGLAKILQPREGRGRFGGLILTLIGVVILGENLRLFNVEIGDIVPLLLVLIGSRIVWHSWSSRTAAPAGPNSSDLTSTFSAHSILGGASRTNSSQDFRGGGLTAILGAQQVDLRGARISQGPAVLDIFTIWGGIEIRVPEDWKVDLQGLPVLATFEDNTRGGIEIDSSKGPAKVEGVNLEKEPSPGSPAQVLIVRGMAIMGGVEIKN